MKEAIFISMVGLLVLFLICNSCNSTPKAIQNDEMDRQELASDIYSQVMESLKKEGLLRESKPLLTSYVPNENDTLTLIASEMIRFIVGENEIIIDHNGISIQSGTNISLNADEDLTLTSQNNLSLNNEQDIDINSNVISISADMTLSLEGAAEVELESGGQLELDGALIRIGGGSKPVARLGDAVVIKGKLGKIVEGSPTVLVGN